MKEVKLLMKTYSMKKGEVQNNWYCIDATDLVLGRLAAIVATYVRGKHKPEYTPHMDCGDNIIIINADKVATTTRAKLDNNKFFWHTGFPGGIKEKTWGEILGGRYPERLLQNAIRRMLPKGPLGRAQLKRVYIYASNEHPHGAQNPQVLDIASMNSKNKR